jgi:hypothetical protein
VLSALAIVAELQPAAARPSALAGELCRALARPVDETAPGAEPLFLASYRPGPGEAAVPEPLRTSAFAYDNALAVSALLACGDAARARRIGEAFLIAIDQDRTFRDGRVRNAYRAGPVRPASPVLLPGWWDAAAALWAEDRYQDGTATGNVAWAGLALMALHDATGEARFRDGASRLAAWIRAQAADGPRPGFTGGRDGYDPEQTALAWKSTEHNLDVAALGVWLGGPSDLAMAASARAFVTSAFDPAAGCFRMGTTPDGGMQGPDVLALDTQLWPLLAIRDAPAPWWRALACAEARLAVPGGFDFNDDRDGLWVEGTAQAALAYRAAGRPETAAGLLASAAAERDASGWLYATREPQVTTGLMIGPQSASADFLYYRRPHLGATAWAALAALGSNPFTGRSVR